MNEDFNFKKKKKKKKQNNLTLSYLPNSANHLLLFMELMVLNFYRSLFLILMNGCKMTNFVRHFIFLHDIFYYSDTFNSYRKM